MMNPVIAVLHISMCCWHTEHDIYHFCPSISHIVVLCLNECILNALINFFELLAGASLVFKPYQHHKLSRGTPLAWMLNKQGIQNMQFLTESTIHDGNGAR